MAGVELLFLVSKNTTKPAIIYFVFEGYFNIMPEFFLDDVNSIENLERYIRNSIVWQTNPFKTSVRQCDLPVINLFWFISAVREKTSCS